MNQSIDQINTILIQSNSVTGSIKPINCSIDPIQIQLNIPSNQFSSVFQIVDRVYTLNWHHCQVPVHLHMNSYLDFYVHFLFYIYNQPY